jgi:ABC-type nitrate/sulfonate/bicarbonate transport system substrate-binding protein
MDKSFLLLFFKKEALPLEFLMRALCLILCGLLTALPAAAETALTVVTTGRASSNEWPLLIAKHKGYLAANGISIDFVSAPSTAQAIQQITAGSVEICASGGLTDPMRAIDKGAAVSILWIQAAVPPYTLWAKPSIKGFADLRGQRIMVGGAKDITRIYLDRMLAPNGLKPSDYDLFYAGTTASRYAALSAGGVDAALLVAPYSFQAGRDHFQLIGRLSDFVHDLPFTGTAVNTAWALAHPDLIVAYLKSFKQGVEWFYAPDHKQEAVEIFMAENPTARADVEATYDYYRDIGAFARDGVVTPDKLRTLVEALAADHDLVGSADPARFVNPAITKITETVE